MPGDEAMSVLSKLWAAGDLITAGKQLEDPKTWANNTALTGVFVAAIAAGVKFLPNGDTIDEHTINEIALGLTGIYTVVSPFVHVAANKDAGLPTKRKSGK